VSPSGSEARMSTVISVAVVPLPGFAVTLEQIGARFAGGATELTVILTVPQLTAGFTPSDTLTEALYAPAAAYVYGREAAEPEALGLPSPKLNV